MLDGKKGMGEEERREEKWLPLRLGEMKNPQSLERRKTLAGQKSNSQGHLRESVTEWKILQTFSPLWLIVYVVKPETCCRNSEIQYMKCTFKPVANFWAICKRVVESLQISVLFNSFAAGITSCLTP